MHTPATPTSPSAAACPGRRHRALRRALPPAALLLALALALAGCGGSSSPGVANLGTTSASGTPSGSGGGTPETGETSAAVQQKMVKFAQCMRTHGEPEFPEPTEGGIHIQNRNGHGPNPESPRFKAAEKACSKYAPSKVAPSPAQQAKMQEQALKFSECMRHHGVPNFPDPKFSAGGGRVTLKLGGGPSSGLNPNSPQFQAAQRACQSNLPFKGGPHAGSGPGRSSSGAVVAP
ncbi:MAG TPA: hypothetical protein VL979_14590 [Solirubrobacteraceae bacterium]|nr:hypothetical protein [Solirubrobacteraceae bacterium]